MIRCVSPADVPFLLELAREAYGERVEDWNQVTAWLEARTIPAEGLIFLRSDHGAAVAISPAPTFYAPSSREWHVMFLAVSGRRPGLEGYRLLKAVLMCARALGGALCFQSETGVDLAPLAKRLGAVVETTPSYRVEFQDGLRGVPPSHRSRGR